MHLYTTTTPAAPGGGGRGASNQSQFAGGGPLGFGEPAQPTLAPEAVAVGIMAVALVKVVLEVRVL